MSNIVATLAALCLAATASAATLPGCKSLPGARALWSQPDLRFVLAGEMHGTVESPAIFRDLVCDAASGKRPVVVGIERSASEQNAIDAFMAAENHEAAVAALLAERGWNAFDGKSSRAMLMLLEALRALKLKGRIAGVVAFSDTRAGESPAQGEQRMASALLAAADRHPTALVVALTGNLHASKKLIAEFGSYPLMAMLLPAARTVSLFVTDRGGVAWNMMEDGCRPHKQGPTGGERRGVVLSGSAAPIPGFDGVLSTGLAASASFPAIEDAPPPPACSKNPGLVAK
jgi:hypothetical protein